MVDIACMLQKLSDEKVEKCKYLESDFSDENIGYDVESDSEQNISDEKVELIKIVN